MDGREDWLLQPVAANLLPYTALDDTRYDLSDFVFALEYLDVKFENERRAHEYQKRKKQGNL